MNDLCALPSDVMLCRVGMDRYPIVQVMSLDCSHVFLQPRVHCSASFPNVCHNLDVNLVSTSTRTLRSQLMHVKHRIAEDQVCGVVYSVDCQCGHTYIGETGRTMNTST